MKIREFLPEAKEKDQDKDYDKYIDALIKKKEQRMQQTQREKAWASKPGLVGTIARGIQRGRKLYKKVKPLATRKIPFAE